MRKRIELSLRTGFCLVLTLGMAGCVSLPDGTVDDQQPAPSSGPQQPALPLPAAKAAPSPPAVSALLARATAARSAGDDELAAVHLERALRIAPGDARLWLELARTRFDQGDFAAAAEFASKASRLSDHDAMLQQEAARLAAMAERQQG